MRYLQLKRFLAPGDQCHLAASTLCAAQVERHTHDFHELFWVEEGEGSHWVGDERFALSCGMLVLVNAADRHGFTTRPGKSVRIVNVAFPRGAWEGICRRYLASGEDLFKRPSLAARHQALSGVAYGQLQQAAEELLSGRRGAMALDRFLLNILYILRHDQDNLVNRSVPDWLGHACREIARQPYLARGSAAFVELAGRSPEHVARAARRFLGKTPTQLVNEARLAYAARRLAQSRDRIADIAADCGLPNLSHFYTLFRGHAGLTPHDYRRRQQLIPGHPRAAARRRSQ